MKIIKKVLTIVPLIILLSSSLGCSKKDDGSNRDLIGPTSAQLPEEIWDGDIDETWFDKNEDVFIIKTAQEFAGLANLVNTGYTSFLNKKIVVENNIYLNDTSTYDTWESDAPSNRWIPIGIDDYAFRGVIDFCGHNVEGMFIDWRIINEHLSNVNLGLFGWVRMKSPDSPVYISNLQLYKSKILIPNQNHTIKNIGSVCGSISNGGTLGKLNGIINTVSDCKISSSESSINYIGGISGFTQANIINCGYTGEMDLKNSPAKIGGIAAGGAFPSFVINSYSTANITGSNIKTTNAGTISYQGLPFHCFYMKEGNYNKNHKAFGYVRSVENNEEFKPSGNGTFVDVSSTVTIPDPTLAHSGPSGYYGDNFKKSGQESYDNILSALNSFSFANYFTYNSNDDNQINKWEIKEGVNHGYPINVYKVA